MRCLHKESRIAPTFQLFPSFAPLSHVRAAGDVNSFREGMNTSGGPFLFEQLGPFATVATERQGEANADCPMSYLSAQPLH